MDAAQHVGGDFVAASGKKHGYVFEVSPDTTQTTGLPPGFELRVLPGVGHMLIEEAPDAVLEAIRLHLAGSSH